MRGAPTQRLRAVVAGLALIGSLVVAGAPAQARVPASTLVSGGGFESPRLAVGALRARPSGPWRFVGTAGITARNSLISAGSPPPPQKNQAAFIRNGGSISQVLSIGPGDALILRATQRRSLRTGLQRLDVLVDGVRVAGFTPADGRWSRHRIALGAIVRRAAVVEIRGGFSLEGQERTALVDAVELARAPIPLPVTGLPAETVKPLISWRTTPTAAGVSGLRLQGDTLPTIDTPVQALAQWRDRVFVGGKFASVELGRGGADRPQSYLAAFDRTTGAWIPSFGPRLDGPVWDLAVTPSGLLIVAGQFTSVNGVAGRRGVVALDPATGALVPGWRADLGLTGSPDRPLARALDIEGPWVYVGGNFTRVTGPDGWERKAGRLARLSLTDGRPDGSFLPDVRGTVNDVDATATRVWIVGQFDAIGTVPRRSAAALSVVTGRPVQPMRQMVLTDGRRTKQYQYAVHVVGDQVWIGGSQHSLQVYRERDLALLQSWVNSPIGDTQVIVDHDGVVYAGSHASQWTYAYENVTVWNDLSPATRRDRVSWLGAWDPVNRRTIAGWLPDVSTSATEGAWELLVDSTGCLWAGGDFDGGTRVGGVRGYAGGFVRFCPLDSVAPSAPTSLTVTKQPAGRGHRLAWRRSTDDRSGAVRYEVLRSGRLIHGPTKALSFVDTKGLAGDRYVVRAVDKAGNRSVSTAVVIAP